MARQLLRHSLLLIWQPSCKQQLGACAAATALRSSQERLAHHDTTHVSDVVLLCPCGSGAAHRPAAAVHNQTPPEHLWHPHAAPKSSTRKDASRPFQSAPQPSHSLVRSPTACSRCGGRRACGSGSRQGCTPLHRRRSSSRAVRSWGGRSRAGGGGRGRGTGASAALVRSASCAGSCR